MRIPFPKFQESFSRNVWMIAVLALLASGGLFLYQSAAIGQDKSREILADDVTKNRPKGNKKRLSGQRPKVYRLAAGRPSTINTPASSNGLIGVTIWHLRPAMKTDTGARMLLSGAERSDYVAQRASSDTPLQRGAKVRLSIESARNGYLYVIDRDLFADGSTGSPVLIFPVRKIRDGDNKVRPGRLIDIPGQHDIFNHFEAKPTKKGQVGELLSVLVTAEPLDLPLADVSLRIPAADLANWEKKWGSGVQKFEMVGGVGQQWTNAEKEAATDSGRRLRQDEPPPQTVFRLPDGKDDGLLVSVTLRYQQTKPRSRR
ncbi:MAG: hypothetical protein ACR2HX_13350 [Pyrinomonadaceae bacterium]